MNLIEKEKKFEDDFHILHTRKFQAITDHFNAELKSSYRRGEIDFTPDYNTPETMLHQLLIEYALKNCPDLLKPDEQTETK